MIRLLDTTLREGRQASPRQVGTAECAAIAELIVKVGVDQIECGHPFQSPFEAACTQAVAGRIGGAAVMGHARARKEDVEAVYHSGAASVGIFAGINSVSQSCRFNGYTVDRILEAVDSSVAYARSLKMAVRFTIEDSSRTDLELLHEAALTAVRAGATRIGLADTVGIWEPGDIQRVAESVQRIVAPVPLEFHLHNDRGLAIANALRAIDCTENIWIAVTVNGTGERCGIVDLSTMVGNLVQRGHGEHFEPSWLPALSRRVASRFGELVSPNAPVVGAKAFTHYAKMHRDAAMKDQTAYSGTNPEIFGKSFHFERQTDNSDPSHLISTPVIRSSAELLHHRSGVGKRFVFSDERFPDGSSMYVIARLVLDLDSPPESHVDDHVHWVDSGFLFIGFDKDLEGLRVNVCIDGENREIDSPKFVFLPAGVRHSYRLIRGSGVFVNLVAHPNYNETIE